MKTLKTVDNGQRRVILFFAGWGMDWRPFVSLARDGYDTIVVWDYRDELFDMSLLDGYSEICLVAWSFGVIAASRFVAAHPRLPFTVRIAVNGTIYPSDESKGIPPAIFTGTYTGLDERNLLKFYRRMCGSGDVFAGFRENMPQRTVPELKDELAAVGSRQGAVIDWDVVYISTRDAIIPPVNQLKAWGEDVRIKKIDAPHMPDFGGILRSEIIDKDLVSARFARRADTYDRNAPVQAAMAQTLASMWHEKYPDTSGRFIEIGAGTGMFTRAYLQYFSPSDLELWDLGGISQELPGRHVTCDAETAVTLLPDSSVDVIASACTVQWFNSLTRFLYQCHRALRPGGLCVISTFAPGTFVELAPYVSHMLDTVSADDLRTIATRIFACAHVTEESRTIEFDSPAALLRHMQLTGVNAVDSPEAGHRAVRSIMAAGVASLTYRSVYMLMRK